MKSLVGLAIISLLALFGSRSFERKVNIPVFFKRFFADGMVYLIAGFIMGPALLGFINYDLITRLSPVITIGLFWIGFLFGINLKYKDLTRLSKSVLLVAIGQACVTFFLVAGGAWFMLKGLKGEVGAFAIAVSSLTLAACASGTNQSTLLRLSMARSFRGPTAQVATVSATLDDLPAIFITGLVTFFWHRTDAGQTNLHAMAWTLVACLLGLFGGMVINVLLKRADSEQSRLLIVLGTSAVGGGLAAYLHLSPIFIGMILGITYINLAERDEEVFEIAQRSESTLYVLFLLIVGSMFTIQIEYLIIFVPVYLLLRTAGKIAGGALFNIPESAGPKPSPLFGLALLSQGGLAIALVVQYAWLYRSPITDSIITIVILGVLINQTYAAPLALRVAKGDRR